MKTKHVEKTLKINFKQFEGKHYVTNRKRCLLMIVNTHNAVHNMT